MAVITQFNAGDVGLRPSEIGVEATAAAARRVNTAYNEAAELQRENGRNFATDIKAAGDVVEDAKAHQEVSFFSNAFSATRLQLTKEWADISANADPNDPTVAQNFMQTRVQPALEQLQQGMLTDKGQAWAQSHVLQFQDHMATTTAADMSTAAKHAIKINADQTLNNLSNEVYTSPDHLDNAIESMDSSLGAMIGSSPTLTEKVGAKQDMHERGEAQLVKAAILGRIDKGAGYSDLVSKYPQYVNLAEIRQFEKAAKVQERAGLIQEKQLQELQKQQNTQAVQAANNKNFTDNVHIDESGKVTIDPKFTKNAVDIAKLPGANADHQRVQLDWAENKLNPKTVQTDAAVHAQLLSDMFNPVNPTSRLSIILADNNHQLSPHDLRSLLALNDEMEKTPLRDPVYKEMMRGVQNQLGTDEKGKVAFANFAYQFIPQYLQKFRTGQATPADLNLNDPKSMVSQAVAAFQRDPQQRMMDRAMQGYGGAPSTTPQVAPQLKDPPADTLNQARNAIAKGKSRDAVVEKLKQMGYSAGGL